jgi:putative ABC transport system substrate-binding protein
MRRREFILVLGGPAAWPLAARGQQGERMRRIGALRVARASPTTVAAWQAFLDELKAHGFGIGSNLIVEMRWADEDIRGPVPVAAELVKSNVDVLVVEGAEANLKAAIIAGPTIPIVITIGNFDPVARGYINSLAHPGGNVTGVSSERVGTAAKQVDLLTQAFPGRTRLGILWDADSGDQVGAAGQAAKSFGLSTHDYKFEQTPYDADAAFRVLVGNSVEMVLVQSKPCTNDVGVLTRACGDQVRVVVACLRFARREGILRTWPRSASRNCWAAGVSAASRTRIIDIVFLTFHPRRGITARRPVRSSSSTVNRLHAATP